MSSLNKPVYRHDCPHCVFIGHEKVGDKPIDMYYCVPPDHQTIVARYGNLQQDFYSGLWAIQERIENKKMEARNIGESMTTKEAVDYLIKNDESLPVNSMLRAVKKTMEFGYMNDDLKTTTSFEMVQPLDNDLLVYEFCSNEIFVQGFYVHNDSQRGILVKYGKLLRKTSDLSIHLQKM